MKLIWPLLCLCLAPALLWAEPREIEWLDLLPEDELEALMNAAPSIDHSQIFNPTEMEQGSFRTVDAIDGTEVRIPGYVVPLDSNERGEVTEILLVPYFGACIHAPPPPPNQIVYAKLEKPTVIDMYAPYFTSGVIRASRAETELAYTAYSIEAARVEPYE